MVKRKELKKVLPEAIIKGIQDTLEDSQEYAPVDKGILVNSGDFKPLKTGGEIVYTAPYAARMEFGDSFRPFKGSQTIGIPAHTRKAHFRADGTFVKEAQISSHSRTYADGRLVGFQSGNALMFRVMMGTPAVKGRFYLTRAFNERISMLGTYIKNRLIRIPGTRSN